MSPISHAHSLSPPLARGHRAAHIRCRVLPRVRPPLLNNKYKHNNNNTPTPDLVAEKRVGKKIMNKRFTSLMTTLILSVFFSISASAYDVMVDGIGYNIVTKAKTAEVTKGDNEYSGDVTIPETITVDNVVYNVTSIGRDAFDRCSGLTSVTIPNSVTRIGIQAFWACHGLTSITIPNSVTSIEACVFQNCTGLTSITIPNSVTSIGDWAFSGCSGLTSITIPNSVTSIGDRAFRVCTGLTSITIPNSVTSIGDWAFEYCSSLTSITIPNSVTSIGSHAFSECVNLENVYCYAEKIPFSSNDIFKDSYIEYATLHVPSSAISYYQTTEPWSGFGTIKAIEGTEGIESVEARGIAIQSAGGFINISGLDNNETVSFYGIDGKALGSAKAMGGTATFAAQSGSIVVAKIGKESIKIAVE